LGKEQREKIGKRAKVYEMGVQEIILEDNIIKQIQKKINIFYKDQ
jgi:hypothetical protein